MFVNAPTDMIPARQIATGETVEAGGTAEVPDDVGESLIEQGWTKARGVKPPTIAEVVADVGDDPVKAQAEIEAEQARDQPRPTLIDKLTAVIAANTTPPEGGNTEEP